MIIQLKRTPNSGLINDDCGKKYDFLFKCWVREPDQTVINLALKKSASLLSPRRETYTPLYRERCSTKPTISLFTEMLRRRDQSKMILTTFRGFFTSLFIDRSPTSPLSSSENIVYNVPSSAFCDAFSVFLNEWSSISLLWWSKSTHIIIIASNNCSITWEFDVFYWTCFFSK